MSEENQLPEEEEIPRSLWQKFNDHFDRPPFLGIWISLALIGVGVWYFFF